MKSLRILYLNLFLLASAVQAQAIDVAVVDAVGGGLGGGDATAVQLNDDTYFDFSATLVDPYQVDSAEELAGYDVVILGGAGVDVEPIWTVEMANALKAYVEGGGALLMTGFGIWNASPEPGDINAEAAAILDAVVPGQLGLNNAFSVYCCFPGPAIDLTDLEHPITQGLPDSVPYGETCCVEYNNHPLQDGDISLGVPNPVNNYYGDGHALIYRENIGAGDGRSVYLGAPHLASLEHFPEVQAGLRLGPGDQLLEQTVAWLAATDVTDPDGGDGGDGNGDSDVDTDGDGVLDSDDFCAGTVIPERVPTASLKPKRWALMHDGTEFDTMIKGRGKRPNRSYFISDTAGCSCEQIIDAQGLGNGYKRNGCSTDVMDHWVELVTP